VGCKTAVLFSTDNGNLFGAKKPSTQEQRMCNGCTFDEESYLNHRSVHSSVPFYEYLEHVMAPGP